LLHMCAYHLSVLLLPPLLLLLLLLGYLLLP
jgi:hypothetical protein